MRIGIDARFYGTFGKGLGRYTQKLIEHLEVIDHENTYVIFLRKENWADYEPKNGNFQKAMADYRWYSIAEQIFIPLKCLSYRLDLMHFTHFNVPVFYPGKFIVTIHDLILTKYPTQRATTLGPLLYRLKHFAYQFVIRTAVRRAKKIVAVSRYTKDEIIKHFTVRGDKVDVTYEAVDPPQPAGGDAVSVLKRYGVRQPYVLYVGNVYPHKNIEGLLEAFVQVRKKYPSYHLVLVGKDDYFFKKMRERVRLLDLENTVAFTGFVTDTDLPYLYRGANLYAFPSFCEGFGLPALEACSYRVPVVASNNSSLPEVLGDAALYFNPHDTEEMVEKISAVLADRNLADRLTKAGIKRIRAFSWHVMARATLELYMSV
ncbi:MAG: glycosyltransferase family 1 protein [Patescibacteria group bacterium]